MRSLPRDMDVLQALRSEGRLKHPPIGLGKAGCATNLSSGADPSTVDPILPSSHWSKPENIAGKDLFLGFGRESLPDLSDEICVYQRSKQSLGTNSGFDV